MSEQSEFADAGIIEWEREVRGYNRQQVDEVVARQNGAIRDLKNSLSQCVAEIERLRAELDQAHETSARPQHEEVSERVGQILKLAEDEANVTRERGMAEISQLRETAKAETDKLRTDTKQETDRLRAEAQERAERMLAAAQEQAERTVGSAKAEADELVASAQAAADQTVSDANSRAESTLTAAVAQAKQQIDDATARATAIHDGAERRLNLLISRHTETVRRLTEIRDVVTSLVSGEAARGSLEEEVARALSAQVAANGGDGRQAASQHDPAGAHRARQPEQQGGHAARPAGPGQAGPGLAGQAGPAQAGPGHAPAGRHDADPLTAPLPPAERHEPGRHQPAVDTTKRADRVLDEASAGGPNGRGVEG